MKYRLKFQHTFEKEAKRLGKRYMSMKSDIASLSEELLANPHLGTDLGGGLRKMAVEETEINLLYIYDKAERSSISKKEIEELLRLNGLK